MTLPANIAPDAELAQDPKGERGLALLTVVLTLAVLSVIALAMMSAVLSSARAQARSWSDARADARADALAEAAMVRAALALYDTRDERRWVADGRPVSFTFDGVAMEVKIEDEFGKIDLNNAGESVIRALFRAGGLGDDQVDALTRNVLDWRDSKGAGVAGVEPGTTRARHGAFQAVDELRLVPGMTGALFNILAPAITVYSQRPSIDPATAPALALRAAQGLDAAAAQARIVERKLAGDAAAHISPRLAGRAVTVRVIIPAGEMLYKRQAVLRLTGDPNQPYWVLDWR